MYIYFLDKELKAKARPMINDLWNGCLNKVQRLEKHFVSRVVLLNKVHPNIPKADENRSIVIESQLRKLLETFFIPKLMKDMKSGY